MTDAMERSLARCAECGKAYRVPDAHKSYACKSCGGTVRARPDEEDEFELEGTVTCSACHAVNPEEERDCVECGQSLAITAPASAEEARSAQREASLALKRGYRWIGGITWLYRLGAAGYGVGTAIAVGALATVEVPLEDGILVVALFAAMTVTMLMGAIQILYAPFAWTLLVAFLASLTAVVHAFGPNPLGIALFWSAGWALLFWASVLPTWGFRRLIARHTDLYVTHHASHSTRRAIAGRSPMERHERLVRAMRRAYRHAWRISLAVAATVVATTVLGTYLVRNNLRPDDVMERIEAFESAWNAGDLERASAFLPEEIRARETTRLAGTLEEYGWGDALPSLGERSLADEGNRVAIEYSLGGVPLQVSWTRSGQRWILMQAELPVPPFGPVLERFLQAWRDSDAEALASFFSEKSRASMLANIQDAAQRRNWDSYPAVLGYERAGDDGEKTVGVTLTIDRGEVTTRWNFRPDGRWGMTGLKLPPP